MKALFRVEAKRARLGAASKGRGHRLLSALDASLSLSLSSYSILPSDRRISSQKRTYLEEKKALPWLLPLVVRVSRFCCLVTTSTVLQGRACGSMTALSPSWVAGMVRVASSLKKYARVWLPKSRSAGSTGQRRFPTEIEVAPPLYVVFCR